jgi:hypothetical protein
MSTLAEGELSMFSPVMTIIAPPPMETDIPVEAYESSEIFVRVMRGALTAAFTETTK